MNAVPGKDRARLKVTDRSLTAVSTPRATKFAPAPSASTHGKNGESIEPEGDDGDRVPGLEVGEY